MVIKGLICIVLISLIYGSSIGNAQSATSIKTYDPIVPSIDGVISPERRKALEIYKRLVGVVTPIDNPILVDMEKLIQQKDLEGAASIATQQPGFYNLVVRDMAAKMSTREETVKAPLSDFVATVVGVTRDGTDARELLTGRLFYMGKVELPIAQDLLSDVVNSNRHYEELQSGSYDLPSSLIRIDAQYLRDASGVLVLNPDPAGLITTRGFMEAHAIAGTNRRLVEFTLRQFTCNSIEAWADANSPDIRVGRDIDRFPGGSSAKYQTSCKACHANMDGFRGAFAKFDFSNNYVKYAALLPSGGGEAQMNQSPAGISRKLNQNTNTFSAGYTTVDDSWVNYAQSPANQSLFGWRGPSSSGSGVNQFATAVANSQAFSKCMAKRVFTELCKRSPASFEQSFISQMATRFEAGGYKLKKLFEQVAVQPECLGN